MSNSRVGARLGTAFGFLLLLLVGVGWLGLSRLGQSNSELNNLSRYVSKVELAEGAESYVHINIKLIMQILISGRKEDIAYFESRRTENRNKIAEIMGALRPLIDSENERSLLLSIENTRIPARSSVNHMIDLLKQGKQDEARRFMVSDTLPLLDKYLEAGDAFVQFERDQMEGVRIQSRINYLQTRRIAGTLMFIAVALAIAIAVFATRRILRDDILREQTKEEIRTLNENLEDKITKRTKDLGRAIQDLESEIVVRRKSEEDLRGSKAELALAQRFAHLGSFQQDLTILDDIESNLPHWSDELFRIFGYEPGMIEASSANFMLAVHPDDRESVERAFGRVIRDGRAYSKEYRVILPDGTERTVHAQWDMVYDQATGNPSQRVGTVQDITELKEAEGRFHKVFNANPEPMIIAAIADSRYVDVNESFLRATAYYREEVIGRTSLELNFWDRQEDRTRFVETLEQHGVVRDLEFPFHTKSGTIRTALASADVIELSGERCFVAIFKDVTEQKLLERQLRQSQKMEAIGQLSGGIAHDFNNLLGVIIGYSEVLEQSVDSNSEFSKQIMEIRKAAERAAALTRQLLAFSRKQVLDPKALNLNMVVADTQKMLGRLIGEHITLITKLSPSLGQIRADQGQMEMVIMNLAVNARDAMPDGGKLVIETVDKNLDEEYALLHPPVIPGNYVMLAVSDTGIGMDTQTQAHIFEPFYTTKEIGRGTGLGLATVYGVVKQSGGYIWVYSEPGLGSTFKIFLPRVDEAVQQNLPREVAIGPARGLETVLLVEDEEALRILTRKLLEQNGYAVLEAGGGIQALEIARQHPGPIHLLLTDMVMPGMNGNAMAEKLGPMRPDMKVIYMSGYLGFAAPGFIDSGATFLPKPISRDALLRKVAEVLSLQKEPATT